MKILVVDDSLSERMLLMARLDHLGHEVVGAANGAEALEIFHASRPDLVLLDVIMPVMDGLDCARRLRAMNDHRADWIPIIFLSQRTDDEDIAAGIEAGGDDYLIKPVSEVVLIAKMRSMERIAAMRKNQADLTASLLRVNEKLLRQAEIDGMTGLLNRRRFDNDLAREWESCGRFRQPLTLAMAGIDGLEKINERHGHLAGDDWIKQVATVIETEIKSPPDLVARYDGGKFCILSPDRPLVATMATMEKIQKQITAAALREIPEIPISRPALSVGLVGCVPETNRSPEMLIDKAREMLGRSRESGSTHIFEFD